MTYHVYVLHSPKYDQVYIGYSSNLLARLRSHNELSTKGWTTRYRPWLLIYFETFADKRDAMIREKELKTYRKRQWIRQSLVPK